VKWFGKPRPDGVVSIEDRARMEEGKAALNRERKHHRAGDWLVEGYGYEIASADVWVAYASTVKAAEKADVPGRCVTGSGRSLRARRSASASSQKSGPRAGSVM
jgi:hypothetical protein